MKNIHKVSQLNIYNQSVDITVQIYKIAESFPEIERFRLTNQLLRATSSIEANIAEGYNRKTTKDKSHFCYIAKGSITEAIFFIELT